MRAWHRSSSPNGLLQGEAMFNYHIVMLVILLMCSVSAITIWFILEGWKKDEKCTKRIHVGWDWKRKNSEVMDNTYFTLEEAMETSLVEDEEFHQQSKQDRP